MVELAAVVFPVTQSSSLSVEENTVRCVVGSEPTSGECHFYGYNRREQTMIDSAYVSGVAVMYGSL